MERNTSCDSLVNMQITTNSVYLFLINLPIDTIIKNEFDSKDAEVVGERIPAGWRSEPNNTQARGISQVSSPTAYGAYIARTLVLSLQICKFTNIIQIRQ